MKQELAVQYEEDEPEYIIRQKRRYLYKVKIVDNLIMVGTKIPQGMLLRKQHGFFINTSRRRRMKSKHFSDVA